MKYLGKIEDNLDMVTKQYVDENGGETEVMIQDDEPTVDFKIWIDTNDNTYGDDTVSIAGGGTGANTSAGARVNLVVPQKPKLLWSGSFSSGSITVPGHSDYELFAFESAVAEGLFVIGGYWAGIGGFSIYGSNYITIMGYRFGVDGDRLSIDSYNKGITSWDPTTGTTATFAATKIYGLVRKDDLQGK